jgi:MarR family
MTPEWDRPPVGDAATAVVLATFRIGGLLLTAGSRLAAHEGLTAARWQVLGAVALAGRPLTVPQIARRMGLTRQAVSPPSCTAARSAARPSSTWPSGSPPGRWAGRSARPSSRPRVARYPDSAVAAPHVFKKVAVPGICEA